MVDWTQFFNPSSFGSFAPAPMSPAANPMAAPSGAPMGIGKGAPVSPTGATGNPQAGSMFNTGLRMMAPPPMQAPPMQLQMARPVGPGPMGGRMGMLG